MELQNLTKEEAGVRHVSTDLQIGHTYDYKEDWVVAQVKLIRIYTIDEVDGKMYYFELEALQSSHGILAVGERFTVSYSESVKGYAYNGMWQLYPRGTYVY